jgi:hypothetical protein
LHIVPTNLSVLEYTSHAREVDCRKTEKKAKVQLTWQRVGEEAPVTLNRRYGDAATEWEWFVVRAPWRTESETPFKWVNRDKGFVSRVGPMESPLLQKS